MSARLYVEGKEVNRSGYYRVAVLSRGFSSWDPNRTRNLKGPFFLSISVLLIILRAAKWGLLNQDGNSRLINPCLTCGCGSVTTPFNFYFEFPALSSPLLTAVLGVSGNRFRAFFKKICPCIENVDAKHLSIHIKGYQDPGKL